MIIAQQLRDLGWDEALISEVSRTARAQADAVPVLVSPTVASAGNSLAGSELYVDAAESRFRSTGGASLTIGG